MQSDSSWPHGRTGVNTFKHTKVTLWPSVMFRWQADCLLRPHIATFLLQKGFKKDICALQTTHNCTWLTSDPTNAPVSPENVFTLGWSWLYWLINTLFYVQISIWVMLSCGGRSPSPTDFPLSSLSCDLQVWGSGSAHPPDRLLPLTSYVWWLCSARSWLQLFSGRQSALVAEH